MDDSNSFGFGPRYSKIWMVSHLRDYERRVLSCEPEEQPCVSG